MPRTPPAAHVSITGAKTSAPQASPSVQVRKTSSSSSVVMTPPRRSAVGPKAALMTAASSAQAMKATHVGDAVEPEAAVGEPAQEQRGHHDRHGVPDRLAEHGSQRRVEVRQQEVADDDAGDDPRAEQHEQGEAHARGRPERRHGAVEIGELQPDAPGEVIGARDQCYRGDVARHAGDLRGTHDLGRVYSAHRVQMSGTSRTATAPNSTSSGRPSFQ